MSVCLHSLESLKQWEAFYDIIYRDHGDFVSDHNLLDEVIACAQLILAHQDDHMPTEMYGQTLYAAKKMINGKRIDGCSGNIIYASEKMK